MCASRTAQNSNTNGSILEFQVVEEEVHSDSLQIQWTQAAGPTSLGIAATISTSVEG